MSQQDHETAHALWERSPVAPDGAPRPPGGHVDAPSSLTPFQLHVVDVVVGLGPGEVLTYAEVALEAGHPGAGQAVANVLRRVPELPWWRVVPASGRLYRTHAPVQQPLLEADGHQVVDRRLLGPGDAPRPGPDPVSARRRD